jgi:stalled ribosome rescue protein Dom34
LTAHYHAVIWIDHHEAHVFHFNAADADETVVHATHSPRHLHSKAGSASGTHVTAEPECYRDVAAAVADSHAILIAGPSSAKTEFVKYLHQHAPGIFDRVGGIETLDRVTDHQLVAEARRYFSIADRMRPQQG